MKYLRLTFRTADEARKSFRVPDPKDNLTPEQIQQAAQAMIAADVYAPALVELVDADVVTVDDKV
jgi:hypothetical protein